MDDLAQEVCLAISLKSLTGIAGVSPALPLLLQAAAFWPVWRWYAARVTDSSDDAWGWVALVTAAIMLVRFKTESSQ